MRPCRHGRACKEPPTVVSNPNSPIQYRVRNLVGKGGFARVYTVVQLTPDPPPQQSQPQPLPNSNLSKRGEYGSLHPPLPSSSPQHPISDRNQHQNKFFALKVISKCRLANTATGREALRNEVSIHRQLQHPAIVRLLSYWEDQYRIYLLMDYVDGPPLEQFVLSRGRLSETEASRYTANVFEALSYLHANRIIHRDVKLANILLSHDLNRVMLCDFGLAAHLDTLHSGKDASVCGTPNYVAPELLTTSALARLTPKRSQVYSQKGSSNKSAKGSNRKSVGYTTSADAWSMGVVLYTMLVGSGPFDGEDIKRTFNRIRTARFTFPIGLKLSPNAKSLIRSLLSEDHTKRPTADEALRHPFFTSRDIPKLVPQVSSHGLVSEAALVERNRDTDATGSIRDKRTDRADARGDIASTRSRRLGFGNRDVRRWSGTYQSANQFTDSAVELQHESTRHERPDSLRGGRPHSQNFGDRMLPRSSQERSSSLTTGQTVERSRNRQHRSSLNTRTMNEMKNSRRSSVTHSSRRSSLRLSGKRDDVLNLSVTLSAALLVGRKCLDDSICHKSREGGMSTIESFARPIEASETPPLVRRWADYTAKHGFATMMEDGRTSICFNDGSIMFFLAVAEASEVPDFAYIPPRDIPSNSKGSNDPDLEAEEKRAKDISKKACLCNLFADLMNDGGRGSMYDLPSACNVSFLKPDAEPTELLNRKASGGDHKDVVHVREWARFRSFRAAAFRLSNHSIHVKFDVGEDRCDDFVFNLVKNTLFYREARTGQAWEFPVKNLGEFSALSENIHSQLELCAQAIGRLLE